MSQLRFSPLISSDMRLGRAPASPSLCARTCQLRAQTWGFPGTSSRLRCRGLCSRWSLVLHTPASRRRSTSSSQTRSSSQSQSRPKKKRNSTSVTVTRRRLWEAASFARRENLVQILLLSNYQFSIAPVVQYKVLWFEVSVDDSFGMQVGEGLHHTSCVKPGRGVLKGTPAESNRWGRTDGLLKLISFAFEISLKVNNMWFCFLSKAFLPFSIRMCCVCEWINKHTPSSPSPLFNLPKLTATTSSVPLAGHLKASGLTRFENRC